MLAAVHSATALPIGAPLNRSSHRPSGRPIHTGHISVRRSCQHRKKSRPSGGSAGELATIGSISGSADARSEEHTSELQSLMRISYAVFCLKKKKQKKLHT